MRSDGVVLPYFSVLVLFLIEEGRLGDLIPASDRAESCEMLKSIPFSCHVLIKPSLPAEYKIPDPAAGDAAELPLSTARALTPKLWPVSEVLDDRT